MLGNILHAIMLRTPFWLAGKLCSTPGIRALALSRLLMRKTPTPYLQAIQRSVVLKDLSARTSLRQHVVCQHEKEALPSFSGQKVALMAHHDPGGMVDPYVVYFLRALRESGYRTVLISTQQLRLSDEALTTADAVLWRNCPGYDFTSWKAALEQYPALLEAEEILLTNDSIFGPMYPLSAVHDAMEPVECDFWGLVASPEMVLHLQSYYLVFRPSAIRSAAFQDFFSRVDTTEDRDETISRYEVVLTSWLQHNGLKAGAFINVKSPKPVLRSSSPIHLFWRQLLRDFQAPFVKRDIITQKNWWLFSEGWEEEIAATGYPVDLLKAYLQRVYAQ